VAIARRPGTVRVIDAAIELAELFDCPVEVLHIVETDVVAELAVDVEALDAARDFVAENVDRLRGAGARGDGHLLRVVGDHGDLGRRIAGFANEHGAQMVLIGTPAERETAVIFNARLIDQLIRHASCPVHIVPLGPTASHLGQHPLYMARPERAWAEHWSLTSTSLRHRPALRHRRRTTSRGHGGGIGPCLGRGGGARLRGGYAGR